MANQWFYIAGGKQYGPVGTSRLKAIADSGELGPSDLVNKEGTNDWLQAASIEGLLPQRRTPPSLPRTTPPPLPPPLPAPYLAKSRQPRRRWVIAVLVGIGAVVCLVAVVGKYKSDPTLDGIQAVVQDAAGSNEIRLRYVFREIKNPKCYRVVWEERRGDYWEQHASRVVFGEHEVTSGDIGLGNADHVPNRQYEQSYWP